MGALKTGQLREVVETAQNQAESREVEIHTRAQQRLLADRSRAEELTGQIADDEDYALRLRNQITEMQRLLTQTEDNIRDAKVEKQSCLDSAHTLESKGISV